METSSFTRRPQPQIDESELVSGSPRFSHPPPSSSSVLSSLPGSDRRSLINNLLLDRTNVYDTFSHRRATPASNHTSSDLLKSLLHNRGQVYEAFFQPLLNPIKAEKTDLTLNDSGNHYHPSHNQIETTVSTIDHPFIPTPHHLPTMARPKGQKANSISPEKGKSKAHTQTKLTVEKSKKLCAGKANESNKRERSQSEQTSNPQQSKKQKVGPIIIDDDGEALCHDKKEPDRSNQKTISHHKKATVPNEELQQMNQKQIEEPQTARQKREASERQLKKSKEELEQQILYLTELHDTENKKLHEQLSKARDEKQVLASKLRAEKKIVSELSKRNANLEKDLDAARECAQSRQTQVQPMPLSPTPSRPSQEPVLAPSPLTDLEKKENIGKRYGKLRCRFDKFHSVTIEILRLTLGLGLKEFGEFGTKLKQLREIMEEDIEEKRTDATKVEEDAKGMTGGKLID